MAVVVPDSAPVVKRTGMSVFAIIAIVLAVLAIPVIGILAAIAIPAYQDYTIRAKVSEGLNAAAVAKLAVSEFAITQEVFPSSNEEVEFPGYSSASVASIDVGVDGMVQITYAGLGQVADKTIILTPSRSGDDIQWDCKAGTLDIRYRPAACR